VTDRAQKKNLVLHVEVPDFHADDLDECARYMSDPDPPGPDERLYIITEEWMRADVGLTLVSLPGEKCMNNDFEIHAFTARIVGAHTVDIACSCEDEAHDNPHCPRHGAPA
jgi:hypothetical protein